ncbi:hypothetical protein ACFX13_020631 [Malus domestica]
MNVRSTIKPPYLVSKLRHPRFLGWYHTDALHNPSTPTQPIFSLLAGSDSCGTVQRNTVVTVLRLTLSIVPWLPPAHLIPSFLSSPSSGFLLSRASIPRVPRCFR